MTAIDKARNAAPSLSDEQIIELTSLLKGSNSLELKVTVPLWKKEVYEGGEEWIGRGS